MNKCIGSLIMVAAASGIVGCASTPPPSSTEQPAVETKAAKPAAAVAQDAVVSTTSYTVVRGDHLWGISGKPSIYGNPYEWPLIFKANRDKIKDADLIEPGQVLAIDKNPAQADVNAAIQHAKTRGTWQLGVTEQSDLNYLSGTKYSKK